MCGQEKANKMTKLTDLQVGDIVLTDKGFTCLPQGEHIVKVRDGLLYIECKEGEHYLFGQADKEGNLVGVRKK